MSKMTFATTTRLRGACSKGTCSVDGLAVIPNVIDEQMSSKFYNNLKYVHVAVHFYKHVDVSAGKQEEFVNLEVN